MEADQLDAEVRSRLLDMFDCAELGIDEFEEWLVEAAWNQRTSLVKDVELLLAERAVLSVEELRTEILRLVSSAHIGEQRATSGGSNVEVSVGAWSFGGRSSIRPQLPAFVGN